MNVGDLVRIQYPQGWENVPAIIVGHRCYRDSKECDNNGNCIFDVFVGSETRTYMQAQLVTESTNERG